MPFVYEKKIKYNSMTQKILKMLDFLYSLQFLKSELHCNIVPLLLC